MTLTVNADDLNTVELLFKNGSVSRLSFESQPKILFEGEKFLIHTVNDVLEFPLENIAKYYFADNASGYGELADDRVVPTVKYGDDKIICQGFDMGVGMIVADISGKILMRHTIDKSDVAVDVSSLETGVYIVSIGGLNIKILKR